MSYDPPPLIDPLSPDLLSTAEVSKMLADAGYSAGPPTVWNWITTGRSGVKLPALYLSKGYRTSREAVSWFLLRVSDEALTHGARRPARA